MDEKKQQPDGGEPHSEGQSEEQSWRDNPQYRGLKPWKKGQSGNPKGRPPNVKWTSEYMRELLQEGKLFHPLTGQPVPIAEGRVVAEALACVFLLRALKGSFLHGNAVLDRTEGKIQDAEPEDKLDVVAAVRKAQEIRDQRKRTRSGGKRPESDR